MSLIRINSQWIRGCQETWQAFEGGNSNAPYLDCGGGCQNSQKVNFMTNYFLKRKKFALVLSSIYEEKHLISNI